MFGGLAKKIPDRNVWIVYVAILLLGIAYGVSIAVLALHLDAHHIPKLAMGGLAAAFAAGIATFALPAGSLVSRIGAKRTLLGALLAYATCVAAFPFLTTLPALSIARFFDGASSVTIWVAAETALLSRASTTNKAFVMSLYAISLAVGYVVGPILATGVVRIGGTGATFLAAGALACVAALVVATRLDADTGSVKEHTSASGGGVARAIFWRTKTSCAATFTYGYFQASVVLFLPLFLIQEKGLSEDQTILTTAFFAAGMVAASAKVGKLGDKHGHLVVMRALATIGGTMVASFVLLSWFPAMCLAVFVAGATLASISPVSLALQGVVTPKEDLGRANSFYNAAYAIGMLMGPPISSVIFARWGGGPMLLHFAALWAVFVGITVVFAADDPRVAREPRIDVDDTGPRPALR
jgi:MFS family permease